MKKILLLFVLAIITTATAFAAPTIVGQFDLCLGNVGHLDDTFSVGGGTWTSSNTSVATISLTTGNVYGVSVGTTNITYMDGSGSAVITYTVYPAAPSPIIGSTTTLCPGSTAAFSDATPGGVWISTNTAVATVSSSGVLTAVASGSAYIEYSLGTPCNASQLITVSSPPWTTITGPSTVCQGSTITLDDTVTLGSGTGTWSSSNPSVATVSSTGVVTGVSVGTVTITYFLPWACGITTDTKNVTVINTTSPPVISGSSSISTGANTTLNGSPAGGTWSSPSATAATLSSTGIVTGLTPGTATITYTISGCGGTASSTHPITVTAFNGISGYVHFSASLPLITMKVWLIKYNPTTMYLSAADSISYTSGLWGADSVYFEFPGVASDSYRVKAAVNDTSVTWSAGYVPTYHNSSFWWSSANVVYHSSGTADIFKDINMMTGTPVTGPGFVEGYVWAGANRGTTAGDPIMGLPMFLINSTGNILASSAVTDASGHYKFNNIPYGSYYVSADSLNYATTPYTGITITAAAPSKSAVNFNQNTLSKTITPIMTGTPITENTALIAAFPNPASDHIDLQWWNIRQHETGTIIITDFAGREVFNSKIDMGTLAGTRRIDISVLPAGTYILSARSASAEYNGKIQIER